MSKINEAKDILKELGVFKAQQNEMSALTLLALCGITKNKKWSSSERKSLKVTKGIMAFMKEKYGREYAANTRETVRRQVLHQLVQSQIVDYNPDNPNLPVNSPNAHYSISVEALKVIQSYKTKNWKKKVQKFKMNIEKYQTTSQLERENKLISVKTKSGLKLKLSPGDHNLLQAAVVEKFTCYFATNSELLYLGDTAKKDLFIEKEKLLLLNIPMDKHSKLPDVVLYDLTKNWIYLIEVVTSHGPMNVKRVFELRQMFNGCKAGLIFVTAFQNFIEFKKYTLDLAWDTEVWIEEFPEHMIHFNGDKFLGPR